MEKQYINYMKYPKLYKIYIIGILRNIKENDINKI